jgi:hypothetical protein
VALVTLCDAELRQLCEASTENKRAYAELHGYTLILAPSLPGRPTAWSKLPALRAALSSGEYDLAASLDADALIMNPTLPLHTLFNWSAHQLLAADHNGPNSGVWLLRATPWSLRLLDFLWSDAGGGKWVAMSPLRSVFRYEQRALHFSLQTALWRRRVGAARGGRFEGANGVRSGTALVHQCVLNSLPSFYQPGDFVVHLAGMKGAAKCLAFRRHYAAACAAAGLVPGESAPRGPSRLQCLDGSAPYAGQLRMAA